VGKPLGIFLFSYIATKLGIASMPSRSTYKQLVGIGMLGGIGFTMSIFTSTLAYNQDALQIICKVSIIAASFVSSIIGFVYLSRLKPAAVEQTQENNAAAFEPGAVLVA
jgi:NhaA family Na+:H+ antiporter